MQQHSNRSCCCSCRSGLLIHVASDARRLEQYHQGLTVASSVNGMQPAFQPGMYCHAVGNCQPFCPATHHGLQLQVQLSRML
jgi:hypothetical protein